MEFPKLYARTAVLASLILAVSACQTAQKPVSLLPPNSAPALKPAAPAASSQAQVEPTPVPPQPQQEPESKPVPAEPAAAQSQSVPAADPVTDLIARVESEYQAGLADYRAAKNEEAKQHFDSALNTLLGSNLD